jgi:hypothetical protein
LGVTATLLMPRDHNRSIHQLLRSSVEDLRIKFDYIQEQLGLPGRPHVEFLSDFLRLAGVLFGLVGIVLLVVFVLGVKA